MVMKYFVGVVGVEVLMLFVEGIVMFSYGN